jgi:hypothetical protein
MIRSGAYRRSTPPMPLWMLYVNNRKRISQVTGYSHRLQPCPRFPSSSLTPGSQAPAWEPLPLPWNRRPRALCSWFPSSSLGTSAFALEPPAACPLLLVPKLQLGNLCHCLQAAGRVGPAHAKLTLGARGRPKVNFNSTTRAGEGGPAQSSFPAHPAPTVPRIPSGGAGAECLEFEDSDIACRATSRTGGRL